MTKKPEMHTNIEKSYKTCKHIVWMDGCIDACMHADMTERAAEHSDEPVGTNITLYIYIYVYT